MSSKKLPVIFSVILLFSLVLQISPKSSLIVRAEDPNLLGYWKFDEGTGSMALDSSGNGNDGTITGATWTSGRTRYALQFDGYDDRVNIPVLYSSSPSALTVAAWIKFPMTLANIYRDIVWHGDNGEFELQFRYDALGWGEAIFKVKLEDGNWYSVGAGEIPRDRWHHVAGIWNRGGSVQIYKDGTLAAQQAVGNYALLDPGPPSIAVIGAYYDAGTYRKQFWGSIDEVRIYDRALSGDEIRSIYMTPVVGLLGYWRFNEGTGSMALDSSGNGNDGTINGATWTIGRSGYALSFGGSPIQYVDIPILYSSSPTAITVSAWVKAPPNPPHTYSDIVFHGDNGQFELQWRWDYTWSYYEALFRVGLTSSRWIDATTGDMSAGQWHHLVGVWTKGGSVKLYTDEVLTGEKPVPNEDLGDPGPSFPALIGAYYTGSAYDKGYKGLIDDVRIYNIALTPDEISDPPVGGVGGFLVPIDKLRLLFPYISLALAIPVATAATIIYVKHVKRRKEKQ